MFEDNAEFGLGMRLAVDKHHEVAIERLQRLADKAGNDLVEKILNADQRTESQIRAQRARAARLHEQLTGIAERDNDDARHLLSVADHLVRRSVWLIRYNPEVRSSDKNPFVLDSLRPDRAFKDYADNELRYRILRRTNPQEADQLMAKAEAHIRRKWDLYEVMATSDEHPALAAASAQH